MWLEPKSAKFIPHFAGLVDFAFAEFLSADVRNLRYLTILEDIKMHFNIK